MTDNEKKLLTRLKGMVESYEIAMGTLGLSTAGGVVYGAFQNEPKQAQELIDQIEKENT
jgi:hypothetical protein